MSDPSDPAGTSNPLASSDAAATTTETDDVVSQPADEAPKSEIRPSPSQSEAAKVESQDSEAVPATNSATSKTRRTWHPDEAVSWLEELKKAVSPDEAKASNREDDTVKAVEPPATEAVAEAPDAFMSRTEPVVRYCDWHEFKNRYPDEDDCCAIEVLLSSRDLGAEIRFEQVDRKAKEKQRSKPRSTDAELQAQPGELSSGGVSDQRLERVRINSAFVLWYLAKVTGESSWKRKPHTFLNPFKIFIRYHPKMEAEFKILKQKFAAVEAQPTTDAPPTDLPDSSSSAKSNDDAGATQDDTKIDTDMTSLKAYHDMTCYMDFVQAKIMPLYTMFEKADYRDSVKIHYSDIWYLFRPGELLYERKVHGADDSEPAAKASGPKTSSHGSGPATADTQLWRHYFMGTDIDQWEVDDLDEKPAGKLYQERMVGDPEWSIQLKHYHIDFDGEAFVPVSGRKWVFLYEGTKDVTSLPIYPIRFAKDHEQILQRLQARGDKFRSLVSQPHPTMSYLGWTLTHDPSGDRLNDLEGDEITFPEHIDSDVVVDFREAYQTCPPWKPGFFTINDGVRKPTSTLDEFAIVQWDGRNRSKQNHKKYEMVVHSDGIDDELLAQLTSSGGFLKTTRGRELLTSDVFSLTSSRHLADEDLALLPCRVFVYSLRDRQFVNADIRHIKPIKREKATFDKLKISTEHKTMIQSVVYEHFQKKEAQEKGRTMQLEISDQDFIRGKGRGLVMLLHGAPGVGKTATAEAVADVYKKPLFPITCGDLGIEPKEVEENLTEIFRLANVWDCILLLDEAEIFLSPREKKDDNLQRNALVSKDLVLVFLRILEYYPGILFLTTNRPGALDEAVKSRVHITLLYPQLSRADTISLFQMNIDRLRMIEKERVAITKEPEMMIEEGGIIDFAEQHFDDFSHADTADCRWNGRQIRNAFQIATSLARYEHFVSKSSSGDAGGEASSSTTGRNLYLGARHFKQVERATVEYDDFRKKMLGATDTELARKKEERGPEGPHHASVGERRRRGGGGAGPATLQRHAQSSPSVPSWRGGRGERPAGPRGGGDGGRPSPGYDPGYDTPRRQTGRRPPASYSPYEGGDDDQGWEYGEEEQPMDRERHG